MHSPFNMYTCIDENLYGGPILAKSYLGLLFVMGVLLFVLCMTVTYKYDEPTIIKSLSYLTYSSVCVVIVFASLLCFVTL